MHDRRGDRRDARVRTPLDRTRARAGAALLSPAATVLTLTTLLPLLVAFGLSFFRYDMLSAPAFVGVRNYTSTFADGSFWAAIGHTLYFAGVQVPVGAVLALAAALLLNQRIAGRDVYRTLVYLPQAASYVVVALIWSFLYDPQVGPVDALLRAAGGPSLPWLTSTHLAMPALILMSVWRNLGYFMVIFLAGLQGIPRELYEAAAVDGASAVARFRHVTLPLLRPVTGFVLITWFLGALQMFVQAYVMTGGGPVDATTTVVYRIYDDAFKFLQVGRASAVAVVLFVVVAVVSLLTRRVTRRARGFAG
ncbi:MAG TPA: sugar ABC transporter permease [Streptosporangiales bacterium]